MQHEAGTIQPQGVNLIIYVDLTSALSVHGRPKALKEELG